MFSLKITNKIQIHVEVKYNMLWEKIIPKRQHTITCIGDKHKNTRASVFIHQ